MNPVLVYTLLIAGCLLGAVASYFFKRASTGMPSNRNLIALLRIKFFWVGGCLYLVAAANNIFLYNYLEYSILLPMSSITYIWTMIVAYKLLGEKITSRKLVGVAAVICGAALLANG